MIKTFALIVRRPDHTRRAFREHYETIHAPTAMPLMQGLARYVRYHVDDELHGTPIFDVMTAFWYRSGEDAAATVANVESEAGDAIRADELTFMDKERNEILLALPEPKVEGDEGDAPLFVLVRAPGDDAEARKPWLAAFDAQSAPALWQSGGHAIHHAMVSTVAAPPSWDRITQLADPPDLDVWIRQVEDAGGAVCVVRSQPCETRIDDA